MTQAQNLSNAVAARLAAVRETKAGNHAEAARLLQPVADARPKDAAVQLEYGNALVQSGAFEQAIAAFDRALAVNPSIAHAHSNRAFALNRLHRHVEAAESARQARAIAPTDNAAANNLAHALKMMGRFAEAAEILESIVARDPNHVEALNNLGDCRRALGDRAAAAAMFDRAIEIRPNFAHAHVNRAFLSFQSGNWAAGFAEYEWRFSLGLPLQHRGEAVAWNGAPAPGRTLHLETEQGHGDAIQFIRLAAAARARVGRVVLMGRREQLALLRTAPGIDDVETKSARPSADSLHVSLMSLPHLLRIGEAGLRMTAPYLAADPRRTAKWKAWLSTLPGRKIGVSWQGTPGIQPDLGRSISLAQLAPLARVEGVTLVSLQKRAGSDQAALFADDVPIMIPPGEFDDGPDAFLDTAALMMSLDHVVSVDTAVAHLAGALGRPIALLLRKWPDWRWGTEGDTTFWYPSMRLFRQQQDGDWTAPLDGLLRMLAGSPRR